MPVSNNPSETNVVGKDVEPTTAPLKSTATVTNSTPAPAPEVLHEFDIKATEDPERELIVPAPIEAKPEPFVEPEGTGRKFAFTAHPDAMNPGIKEIYFRIRYQAQMRGKKEMMPDGREIWESTIVDYLGPIDSRKIGLMVNDADYDEAVESKKKRLSSLGVVDDTKSNVLVHKGPIVT